VIELDSKNLQLKQILVKDFFPPPKRIKICGLKSTPCFIPWALLCRLFRIFHLLGGKAGLLKPLILFPSCGSKKEEPE
jgi:hypothetical protein